MRAPSFFAFVGLVVLALSSGCGAGSKSSGLQSGHNGLQAGASGRPGMGAIPYGSGVTFRTWAPSAQQVFVAGDFNGWNPQPLTNENNGNFSADIEGARAGQQYKLKLIHNGQELWRVDPRAQQVVNSSGNAIIHDPASYAWKGDFLAPNRNEQVVYELHLGAFNATQVGHPGTWASASQKLDYLRDLGVNVLEVMPVAEFPGDYSWGYNPANPFAPESAYGSPDQMKSFVDQAHARGMAVVLDVVYNHFGPSDLPLWQFDGASFGKGGIYFYNDGRATTPWGDTRPDYGRQEVRDYIRDNAKQWLDEYRMDGLRLDATSWIRHSDVGDVPDGWRVLQSVSDAVHGSPGKFLIAEDMQQEPAITRGTGQGGAGFDAQWEPAFVHPVQDALTQADDANRNLDAVVGALTHNYNGDAFQRVVYTESHDEVANGKQRVPAMADPSNPTGYYARKRSTLGAVLALTSPGRPMILQGQEFVTGGWFRDSVPLDWSYADRFSGVLQMYRDLIHLRRDFSNTTAGLRGGGLNVFHVNHGAKVLAYHRWENGGLRDDTVVVVNLSNVAFPNYTLGLPRGGTWKVRFNSDWKGYSPDFGGMATGDVQAQGGGMDGLPNRGTLSLGAYAAVILSQE